MIEAGDGSLEQAAITALGELDAEAAHQKLQELLHSENTKLRKAAAKALFRDRERRTLSPRPLELTEKRLKALRGDNRPFVTISLDAALRYAMPELRSYEERDLTARISRVCSDYAATRRYLIMEGLMTRAAGIYEFTEAGKAVWQVERFILEHYLKGRRKVRLIAPATFEQHTQAIAVSPACYCA